MALIKTKGLVMRSMKYRETSLICDIYCRELGMRSFLIQGVRKQRTRVGAGFFQPMQVLDLVVYDNPNSSLNKIKEANASPVFLELQSNIPKSAVGLFLIELARRSIRELSPNEELFDFLEDNLLYLESTTDGLQMLPLWMGIRMTGYLGFSPHVPDEMPEEELYFDLRDGVLTTSRPFHPDLIPPPLSRLFSRLSLADRQDLGSMRVTRDQRDELFDRMIDYYRLHVEHFGKLRSPDIFRELF